MTKLKKIRKLINRRRDAANSNEPRRLEMSGQMEHLIIAFRMAE